METYSGPGPYSEPETRNIREFVKSIQSNVVVSQRHLFWDEDLLCLRKCFGEMLQNFTRFLEYKKETLNIYLFLFIMINLVNFDKHFIKHNLEGRTKIRKKIA